MIRIATDRAVGKVARAMHPMNQFLGLLGLRLSRVAAPESPEENKAREVAAPMRVGRFDILMPPGHPAYEIFRTQPGFMSELGRIAAAVYAQYPDMIAVDVGANIGDTAAVIRSACPAPIICVEGDPTLQGILAENSRNVGDITIRPTFLSDAAEIRTTQVTKQGWNSTLIPAREGDPGESIRFITLDEALLGFDFGRIKLLKIDTEGFDGKVMRGAPALLSAGKPAIFFEYNRENLNALGEDGLGIFEFLRNLGYHQALIWDERGRFLCGATLDQTDLLHDLHGYIDFRRESLGRIAYLDVCAFHRDDGDLAGRYLADERRVRLETGEPLASIPES